MNQAIDQANSLSDRRVGLATTSHPGRALARQRFDHGNHRRVYREGNPASCFSDSEGSGMITDAVPLTEGTFREPSLTAAVADFADLSLGSSTTNVGWSSL